MPNRNMKWVTKLTGVTIVVVDIGPGAGTIVWNDSIAAARGGGRLG